MDLGISQTTVALARERLAHHFFPSDESNPAFLTLLSEVVERFHSTDKWIGSRATFRFVVPESGVIHLPFHLDNVLAATFDRKPAYVRGDGYQFLYDGPGEVTADTNIAGLLVDAGVVGISSVFPTTPSVLTVSAAVGSDIGKEVRIQGFDQDNTLVVDSEGNLGEMVTLSGTAVTTTTIFSAVKSISKPVTKGTISVSHGSTVLVRLEPRMETPYFRSYQVLEKSVNSILALCKRRLIPIKYEEDFVFPGNLGALKNAMFAITFENSNNIDTSWNYMRLALELLNKDSSAYLGPAIDPLQFNPWGEGVPGLRGAH